MKTMTKYLIATSLLIFGIATYAAHPINIAQNGGVTYTIMVHPSPEVSKFTGIVYIGILNESGTLIAPPQVMGNGTTFTFNDPGGGYRSIRRAILYAVPVPGSLFTVTSPADSKNGPFLPGSGYNFNLYPTLSAVNPSSY
jgi:hypothetical protein